VQPSPILIDTDPGIDDAMALLFLRARPEVRITAITTIYGNADIQSTTRNANYLVKRFGIDAPVIAGSAKPLQIERLTSPTHVHGRDGLGDVLSLPGFEQAPAAERAHEHIVRTARSMPGQLSILALGPLTNLALALQLDPDIAALVRQVVVMGGAFGWGGRSGNVSPVAEANIRNDPHAANAVLAASWPVTMVGLDVTTRCVFTTEDAQQLAIGGGEAGRLLWEISRDYEALYKLHDGLDGCCLHDVAAAACLLDPTLFATRSGVIRVATDGVAIGQTLQSASGSAASLPPQRACHDVDAARLVRMYAETLLARA
jgi:purine nucleosidase